MSYETRTYKAIDTTMIDAQGNSRPAALAVEIPTVIRVQGVEYKLLQGKDIKYAEVRK